ncbi:hypothetical protein SODALDRAFT_358311 [Sodiomyces alkalinus F11]|uniref:Uncharacterized protein n=1 Tax=Sodiomyces alkalinus (strain CBS 110278 / VKM F-3762 / F11) TaxID=1314773 RepID=A0A3N2PZP3_SODAK|nr:hypothetical protein SODALDRAFT_358311 [Sodiomyces alkalinus F11]ROT39896.1 hypothetical protein SODALDRAFT_358311 [Sodiomyces alkalinus F11]
MGINLQNQNGSRVQLPRSIEDWIGGFSSVEYRGSRWPSQAKGPLMGFDSAFAVFIHDIPWLRVMYPHTTRTYHRSRFYIGNPQDGRVDVTPKSPKIEPQHVPTLVRPESCKADVIGGWRFDGRSGLVGLGVGGTAQHIKGDAGDQCRTKHPNGLSASSDVSTSIDRDTSASTSGSPTCKTQDDLLVSQDLGTRNCHDMSYFVLPDAWTPTRTGNSFKFLPLRPQKRKTEVVCGRDSTLLNCLLDTGPPSILRLFVQPLFTRVQRPSPYVLHPQNMRRRLH